MTAPAIRRGSSGPVSGSYFRFVAGVLAATSLATTSSAALAQVGAVVSVYSDLRFRGASLSDARPVGILDLSYDARNGIYGALSGSLVVARDEGLQPLGFTLNAGYAERVSQSLSLDFGGVHSRYSHYSGVSGGRSFTEFYAGVAGKLVGARVAISPNYYGAANWTAHGEINGHVDVTRNLVADAQVGALFPIGSTGYSGSSRPSWDARIGLTQRVGRISLHGAATGWGGGGNPYGGRAHRRGAVVIGVSAAL